MKWGVLLIILFSCLETFSQTINWETNVEKYVKNYEVEKSVDGINFTTDTTLMPTYKDTNNYAYPIKKNIWYRLKANMISGTFTTDQLILKNEFPNIFINPSQQTIQLK